jgi:gliding motility-associated-like protein
LNSFQVTQPPVSQAIASITSDHYLEIDYNNVEFFGTDNLRIQACDLLDACTESTFSFQIERNGGIVVFNAVAPHSTGNNKYMRILNLPAENKVMVFNRWGDLVFNTQNYNDETPGKRFEGVGLDGKSLPTGTYFYKIEFEGGISVMTGYLALKQ